MRDSRTHLDADGREFPPDDGPRFVLREADAHGLGLSGGRRRRAADACAGHRDGDGGHQGDGDGGHQRDGDGDGHGDVGYQGERTFGQAACPRAGGAVCRVAASRLAVGLAALLQVGVLRRLRAALHRHRDIRLGGGARRDRGRSLGAGWGGETGSFICH